MCDFEEKRRDVYQCTTCYKIHKCGINDCEHLFYNRDFISVCKLTGKCFNQQICEPFDDCRTNQDPVFRLKVKRDQQIKNRSLNYDTIFILVNSVRNIVILSQIQTRCLCNQILELWYEFIQCTKDKETYTHRKDKRCFVISIVMSLNVGICTNNGQFIIHKHPHINVKKINKKSKYKSFKVSGKFLDSSVKRSL